MQILKDADARDLGEEDLSHLRTLFESPDWGLFYTAKLLFGYNDLTEDLHLPICQFLGRWGSSVLRDGSVIWIPPVEGHDVVESFRRLHIRIPREHFKTSLCTRANAFWTIARDPAHDATIGIFNEKEENAASWIAAICEVVEGNHLLQLLWREMMPRGVGFWDKDKGIGLERRWKWGGTGLRFIRDTPGIPELSIEPHGVGSATTGKHFTHKILDDIIGEIASKSPAAMESVINWVDNARPLERPAENGCELVCYTPWGYRDVYRHQLEKWPGEYQLYQRSLLEDEHGNADVVNGKSIFPSKISTEKARRMAKTDSFQFWSQYMCIPKAGRDQSFDPKWNRRFKLLHNNEEPVIRIEDEHYDKHILDMDCGETEAPQFVPLSWCDKVVILDPAPSKPSEIRGEPGARNGMLMLAMDPWGRYYAMDEKAIREDSVNVMRAVITMMQDWKCNRYAVEEVNFSNIYQPFVSYILAKEHPDFRPGYTACKTKGRNKDERIKGNLIGPMDNGFWYFGNVPYLLQEIAEYPNSETKDLIDALSYGRETLRRPETPKERYQSKYMASREDGEAGMTGYGQFSETDG